MDPAGDATVPVVVKTMPLPAVPFMKVSPPTCIPAAPKFTVKALFPVLVPNTALSPFTHVESVPGLVKLAAGDTELQFRPVRVHALLAFTVPVVVVVVAFAEIRNCVGEMISVIVAPVGMPVPVTVCPTLRPVVLVTVTTLLVDDILAVELLPICVVPPLVRLKTGAAGVLPVLVSMAQ